MTRGKKGGRWRCNRLGLDPGGGLFPERFSMPPSTCGERGLALGGTTRRGSRVLARRGGAGSQSGATVIWCRVGRRTTTAKRVGGKESLARSRRVAGSSKTISIQSYD